MADFNTPLAALSAAPVTTQKRSGNFYEALAEAWGKTLDEQANKIVAQSDIVAAGDNTPAAVTKLTTESLLLGIMSNNAHTSITKSAEGLETMARKQ